MREDVGECLTYFCWKGGEECIHGFGAVVGVDTGGEAGKGCVGANKLIGVLWWVPMGPDVGWEGKEEGRKGLVDGEGGVVGAGGAPRG